MCAAVVLGWWTFKVQLSHGGNWTALYCTGSRIGIPEPLKPEGTYAVPNSWGYDGQFYHFIAHDPWLTRGFLTSVDNPPLRWRRVLVSLLAWTLAAGRDAWIDPALYAVVLGFVALGGYWLASYFRARGSPGWWGLLFLLSPATLVVLDRVVVDIAVTSLCCAFLLFAQTSRRPALWTALAAAALARETGLILAAGWCVWLAGRRDFRGALLFASSVVPAGAWWAYVAWHTPEYGMPGWGISPPPARLLYAFAHPSLYAVNPLVQWVLVAFDYLSLVGSVLALALAARAAWRAQGFLRCMIPAFGIFGFVLTGTASLDVFQDVFSHGRLLSPLTLLLAAEGLPRREWLAAAPIVPAALRIGMLHGGLLVRIMQARGG